MTTEPQVFEFWVHYTDGVRGPSFSWTKATFESEKAVAASIRALTRGWRGQEATVATLSGLRIVSFPNGRRHIYQKVSVPIPPKEQA
jgi:hypothetical protein